jgi:aminoglycoside phosphotransferase (APT) family kinase protein
LDSGSARPISSLSHEEDAVTPSAPAPIDIATLAQLLRSAIGVPGAVAGYRVTSARRDYAVIVAQLSEPAMEVVVKLAGPDAPIACPFNRTAAIARLVRERTDIPTFEVLAVDVSYRVWPWRYLITTCVPGETWSEVVPKLKPHEAQAIYYQLGRAVAAIHTLRFPACGEIGADGVVAPGAPYLSVLIGRARRRIASAQHADLFISLAMERAELFGAITEGALCHDDLNPHNLLLRSVGGHWQLAAVLDFDSAWSGDPESDLARLDLWRGMTGEGFYQAYEAIRPISPRYLDRRPLYQLLWCLEYARPTPQHRADTAHVCAQLGIAPITFP